MKDMFEQMQGQFSSLADALTDLNLHENDLSTDSLSKISDSLGDTYILLNEGFCENIKICEKCIQNRDQLRTLLEMVDNSQENGSLDDKTYDHLVEFKQSVPSLLTKMQKVYEESVVSKIE